MNRFFDLTKMMKGKSYPFLIANTDRSDKNGTYWWSLLDIDGKKDFLLFNSFGINFLANSYRKLTDNERASLSDTANDLLHFIEYFTKFEKQNLIHLWLLEDADTGYRNRYVWPFQRFFYENLFFPNNDSVLSEYDKFSYEAVQDLLNELFTTDTKENEKIIREFVEFRNVKMATT